MIERLALGATLHPQGNFTQHRDFAAEEWRTDAPERPDSLATRRWKMVLDYGGTNQQFGYYWDGLFRYTNGTQCRVPLRWAYLRLRPELWTGTEFVLPDGSAPVVAAPVANQAVLDLIIAAAMKLATPTQIMDAMDRNLALQGTGAPEDGAGAPR